MSVEPALGLDGLVAAYGRAEPIVRGVSASFEAGTVTTIIGPNGAGKSTLLKCVAGVVSLRAGAILVAGQDISRRRVEDRIGIGIGFCAQGRANFGHLTVEQNLRLAGFRLSRRRLRERLAAVRAEVPLVDAHWHAHVANLSGGQQQAVEIGMALVSEPSILLLDEPSLGLSRTAGRDVLALARKVADEGACVVVVEQNVGIALDVSDRLLVLEEGQVSLAGVPDTVLADPKLREVYLGRHGSKRLTEAAEVEPTPVRGAA